MMSTGPHQSNPAPFADATAAQSPRGTRGRLIGWVLFIGVCAVLFLLLNVRWSTRDKPEIPLSELRSRLMAGDVAVVFVEEDMVFGRFHRPTQVGEISAGEFRTRLPAGMGQNWSFINWVLENARGAEVRTDSGHSLWMNLLLPLVPWFLIFAFIWFFVFRQLRRAQVPPQAQMPLPVVIVNPPITPQQTTP